MIVFSKYHDKCQQNNNNSYIIYKQWANKHHDTKNKYVTTTSQDVYKEHVTYRAQQWI